MSLADVDPLRLGSFDTVVAVNVNLFWTGPYPAELNIVRRLLRPEGRLWIAYDYQPVEGAERERLETKICDRLGRAGFDREVLDPRVTLGAFVLVAYVRTGVG